MNASPEEIRVWLVEDNEIYRRGLTRAIDSAQGMSCAGDFDCAETALKALDAQPAPEVILLDVGLPGMDGRTDGAGKHPKTLAREPRRHPHRVQRLGHNFLHELSHGVTELLRVGQALP